MLAQDIADDKIVSSVNRKNNMENNMSGYGYIGDEADLKAIESVRDAHVAALNAGDARGWASQFTDDGVQMPPHMPANIGRAAIEAWTAGFMKMFNAAFALSVDEVRVLGEWAFERGAYTIGLDPKAGGPAMEDAGKYITIYRRKPDNSWGMARDIWNSSSPLPGL